MEGGYLVSRIKYLSSRQLNRLIQEAGLEAFNGEQGKILYALWQHDGMTCTAIASFTGLALNTLTKMLETLEKDGLITREQCSEDKRKKRVYLTRAGRDLEKASAGVTQKMNARFYAGFSPEAIVAFEAQLKAVIKNLEAHEHD